MAKRVTVNRVNMAIAQFGYEIQVGYGYFYFYPIFKLDDKEAPLLYGSSVYVNYLNAFPLGGWVHELFLLMAETSVHHYMTEWWDTHTPVEADVSLTIIND